jgi:hypothetical protein
VARFIQRIQGYARATPATLLKGPLALHQAVIVQ